MKKYSKQRELILQSLRNRVDHPTADMLYADIKNQMPEIGIATVYRNLADLYESGEIAKLKCSIGPDRFDGNMTSHIHFECEECHEIYDIMIQDTQTKKIENEIMRLSENIGAQCKSSQISLMGLCKKCKQLVVLKERGEKKKC